VIGSSDLGKSFRLGAVGLVAARADDGGIEFRRLDGSRIVGVPGLRAVTGFAGDYDMLAQLFLIDHLGVAGLANIVSGVSDRALRDFLDRIGAVMTVLTKRTGHDGGTQDSESNQGDGHDCGEPDQVFDIFEQVRFLAPRNGRKCACAQ
jgi:hypothetical protein